MALLGISARIVWGDALSGTSQFVFDTPNLQMFLLDKPLDRPIRLKITEKNKRQMLLF
jgi:hypothetical protein